MLRLQRSRIVDIRNSCYMQRSSLVEWVLLLAQLPAAPSSARVALWRRMRAAGATSVPNGAWVLPASDDHQKLFADLAETVRSHGGHATVMIARAAEEDATIVAHFRTDRAREYAELRERCEGFLDEVEKERAAGKFTFAELEELEDEYDKLAAWLGKIRARDFFPGEVGALADAAVCDCAVARDAFAQAVYAREGLDAADERPSSAS
jgi:hypothetical protein